jgi:ABC-type xylose transport system permease subunit
MRARAQNKAYGIEDEPTAFFVIRNAIVAGAILFLIFKLSTFRGLPNVLITMGVLTISLRIPHRTHDDSRPTESMRWAGTRRRRSCRALRPSV